MLQSPVKSSVKKHVAIFFLRNCIEIFFFVSLTFKGVTFVRFEAIKIQVSSRLFEICQDFAVFGGVSTPFLLLGS